MTNYASMEFFNSMMGIQRILMPGDYLLFSKDSFP
jgi:hypothetical protein